jgi:hypothetical protein
MDVWCNKACTEGLMAENMIRHHMENNRHMEKRL